MPQARAICAQPHTYNRRLQEMEPAAQYHPNNPEAGGSPRPAPAASKQNRGI